MLSPLSITTCYAFVPLEKKSLKTLQRTLKTFGEERQMRGLMLIAPEGINATVSGTAEAIAEWKSFLTAKFGEIVFKNSEASNEVFSRFSVKIKPEIVSIKDASLQPGGKHRHLTPEEWQKTLESEDVVIVDARNVYETSIGKFQNAVDPGINAFYEFPQWAAKTDLPKDKKVLMYCTGGIRCEKAILAMEAEGFNNVHQLEGGILAYLEKFPDGKFAGECFVFDHRVAVDKNLKPSSVYGLCPHCGDAGDKMIMCPCGKQQKVCEGCSKDPTQMTCSKRCRNEVRMGKRKLMNAAY